MLTENDVKALVLSGEGYNVEFKVRIPSKARELAEEVCAFANAAGGVLLLGVDDQNQLQGISLDNTRKSVVQQALHEITPHLYCPFYIVSIEGKEIGVIEVPSGLQKPYTLSGAIYVRQGPNTQKILSVEQMRDFFQQSDRIYFDEGACPDFDVETDLERQVSHPPLAMTRLLIIYGLFWLTDRLKTGRCYSLESSLNSLLRKHHSDA